MTFWKTVAAVITAEIIYHVVLTILYIIVG